MNNLYKLAISFSLLLIIACNNKPKLPSISGNIKNLPNEVTFVLLKTPSQIKKIKIKEGVFKDTVSVDNQFCYIQIGSFQRTLFLDKESQLNIEIDANDYENSLKYSGKGSKTNEYLNKREVFTEKIFENIDSINKLTPIDFKEFMINYVSDIEALFKVYADINTYVIKSEKENLDLFVKNVKRQYNRVNNIDKSTLKGSLSPEFNYENYKGGTTSLKDLRGNYVYIDVWATWCPPCIAEIPYLKKLEEKFHQKNIKFVCISVDKKNAKNKWKQMIKEKGMGGIQLFANGDEEFAMAYDVMGIPRFILIDTEGKIISANAPRPSNPKTIDLLNSLP